MTIFLYNNMSWAIFFFKPEVFKGKTNISFRIWKRNIFVSMFFEVGTFVRLNMFITVKLAYNEFLGRGEINSQ